MELEVHGKRNRKVWASYSMIFPLARGGCNLGVLNGSHLSPKEIHLGTATKVHIPYGCVIIFHACLYHYGDKSQIEAGSYSKAPRAFSYIVEHNYPTPEESLKTWKLTPYRTCDLKNCKKCEDLKTFISNLVDTRQVWYPSRSTHSISTSEALYGNLDEFGWVVIKGSVLEDLTLETTTHIHLDLHHLINKQPEQSLILKCASIHSLGYIWMLKSLSNHSVE